MKKTIQEKIDHIDSVLSSQSGLSTESVDSTLPNPAGLIVRDKANHLLIQFSPEIYLYPISNEVAYIDITSLANDRARLTLLKGKDGGYSWSLNKNVPLGQLVSRFLKNAKIELHLHQSELRKTKFLQSRSVNGDWQIAPHSQEHM